VLAPGESVRIPFYAKATIGGNADFALQEVKMPATSLNWDAYETKYRDLAVDPDWKRTWANFKDKVGNTWDSFYEVMRETAEEKPLENRRFVTGDELMLNLLAQARLKPSDNSTNSGSELPLTLLDASVAATGDKKSFAPLYDPNDTSDHAVYYWSHLNGQGLNPHQLRGGKWNGQGRFKPHIPLPGELAGLEVRANAFVYYLARAMYGEQASDLYKQYLNSTRENPTPRQVFSDGDEIVEGFRDVFGRDVRGFKNSEVTKTVIQDLFSNAKSYFMGYIRDGIIDCERMAANTEYFIPIEKLVSQTQGGIKAYEKRLVWGGDPEHYFPIPAFLAGEIGSTGDIDVFGNVINEIPDERHILGNIAVTRRTDIYGETTSIELKTKLRIIIKDGIDFMPGNLGNGLQDLAITSAMAELEAYNWAYDVLFTVDFTPEPLIYVIDVKDLPKDCDCVSNEYPLFPPPFPPDADLLSKLDKGSVPILQSRDPNDIIGPSGFGEQHWVTATESLPYTIRFENQPDATAPVHQLNIVQQLDPDLDWRTFRLGDFGWGDLSFNIPANRSFYNQRLDFTDTLGFFVDVTAGINIATGEAFWKLTAIDPNTGELIADPSKGFLPPNDDNGSGEGFVNYKVQSRRDTATGAVIEAKARIIFR
jgi:hypothetical protein